MVIFHSYVSLPESMPYPPFLGNPATPCHIAGFFQNVYPRASRFSITINLGWKNGWFFVTFYNLIHWWMIMLPANLSKNIALFHWLMIILPHPFKNHFIGQFMIKKQKTLYQWTIILPMTYSNQFLPIHWIPSANDVILPYLTYDI